MRAMPIAVIALAAGIGLGAGHAPAQQVTAGVPVQRLGDGFFESFGVGWGLNWKNGFFRFGGPGPGLPPFGNFDPNAAARLGFGFRAGGANGYFNAFFGQGYRQSLAGQMPILTLTNGIPGFIADQTISPFVTGWVPVVGTGYVPPLDVEIGSSGTGADAVRDALARVRSGLPALPPAADTPKEPKPPKAVQASSPAGTSALAGTSARPSSAAQAAPSVAEARRLRAADEAQSNADGQRWLDDGQKAESAGKPGMARVYYQRAAHRATGELKQRAAQRLEALATPQRPD